MKYLLCCFFLLFTTAINAQADKVYSSTISGIKLFQQGNQFSYPIINLGTTGTLELHFDDLDPQVKNYNYTYQLCDANWQASDLNALDYIQGFTQNNLNQYRFSSVAKVRYVHYQVILPEQNCVPTKAGNYLLKVFLNGDTSKLAFTRRLLIVNNILTTGVSIQQPYNSQLMQTTQKVQFTVNVGKLNIFNPQQQLKVVVLQNYRWDNAKTNLQPLFMRGNMYEYNGEQDCLFPAGKEYRWADLRSFRFLSERIAGVDRSTQPVTINLIPDVQRTAERLMMYQDVDGFFQISTTDANNPWWQGDYGNVNFTFSTLNQQPFADKDVYILGELTGNRLSDSNKMVFNAGKGRYEKSLFLKQGFYNYIYVTRDKSGRGNAETYLTEGDYWETENDYTVLVYYRSLSGRHDELVGVTTVNSRTGKIKY